MRTTQAYGINGSKYDEMGRCMEPKEVYSKYENFGDPARHSTRHFDMGYFFDHLVPAFVKEHGRKPTKAYSRMMPGAAKSVGRTIAGIGFVMLDIVAGQERDYVE